MTLSSILRPLLALLFATSASVGCSEEPAAAKPRRLAPAVIQVFSLQVTDVERDQFGKGKKPATHQAIAFWLANSGTAAAGRFRTKESVARFDEGASRLLRFNDDKGTDLTTPPGGQKIDTFFDDNKPLQIGLGPGEGEGEFVVRGYRIPAEGATALHVEADLAFMLIRDRKTAEAEAKLSEGSETELGPLRFVVVDPEMAQRGESAETKAFRRVFSPDGATMPTAKTHLAFQFEPADKAIGSVEGLGRDGTVLFKVDGESFGRSFTYFHQRTSAKPTRVRVTYYESAERVVLPLSFDVRLGLR